MPVELEIDGKKVTFQDDEIVKMSKAQAATTQKGQHAAAVLSACEKHGVTPEEFLSRSEGAFSLLADLVDSKVIDNEGKLVTADPSLPPGTPANPSPPPGPGNPNPSDKMEEIVAKALAPALEQAFKPFSEKIAAMEQDQGKLIQRAVAGDLKAQVQGVEDDDIPKILAAAKADPSKKLMEHAKERVAIKATERASIEKEVLEKYNIDPEKNDPNLRKELAEGGAGIFIKGKEVSFDAKEGDEKTVTPAEASAQYLDAQENT